MTHPDPLNPVEAHDVIQRLLERDALGWTDHARDRAVERNFTADDVCRVLIRGTINPNPEWDDTYDNWVYRVRGYDYDGERLAVVVAIEPELGRLTVITGEDW